MDSDIALLKACLAEDAGARDGFVNRFTPVVFAAVRRVFGGRPGDPSMDAEDMVQDAFLRLFKNDARLLRTYDPERSSLTTWLTVVARSTAIDAARRKRPVSVPFEPDLHVPGQEDPAPAFEPFVVPEGLLSARQRLVLHLLFEKEWEVREVARLLGVGEQTVRSTKHKALDRLRALAARGALDGETGSLR